MPTFTVDTHLFRELGELLVGRDSTALIELVKNAYDADATQVTVSGEHLAEMERGQIQVSDNGVGMTPDEFTDGFLRIAARTKEQGERRSERFRRRYTGAKGIGRLAAHKLARVLEVNTLRSRNGDHPQSTERGSIVDAKIDWDLVESKPTLDLVNDDAEAITIANFPAPSTAKQGTTITLKRLRRRWTPASHGRFLEEVQTFQVPEILVRPLPESVLPKPLIFSSPTIRDVENPNGNIFSVKLEGDLAPPDDYWSSAVETADWVIEIDADASSEQVRYGVAPTTRTLSKIPDAEMRTFSLPHPSKDVGPFFNARILVRTGTLHAAIAERQWAGRASGIRVYMEGFRVLPYGEKSNDWLSLDRDAAARDRGLLIREEGDPLSAVLSAEQQTDQEGLSHLPNKQYFGAVFLTTRGAEHLSMLVNREGFIPNEPYNALLNLVRVGIDLSTRVRAAATLRRREARREKRSDARREEDSPTAKSDLMPTARTVLGAMQRARDLSKQARSLAVAGKLSEAGETLSAALSEVNEITEISEDLVREGAMLRVLASIGTQLAAFVHEVNALLGLAETVEKAVEKLRAKGPGLTMEQRRTLAQVHRAASDLRRNLERQASYLVDVVTPDARRRRSRQGLADRFDAGARLIAHIAERRGIKIENNIPTDLKSPPMFPAELTTVFSNLLTNAVKAAGNEGRIRATAKSTPQGTLVRIENTGVAVNPARGERWFRPFESTTTTVDAALGQGMGLGLPITRNTLEEYGATIRFVEPASGFETALEIKFPAR